MLTSGYKHTCSPAYTHLHTYTHMHIIVQTSCTLTELGELCRGRPRMVLSPRVYVQH